MIRTYGKDALVTLIRSYADGHTDDEAFTAALGLDTTAFGEAWFKDVNAKAPTKYGPQPAPPGPVPSAWEGAVIGAGSSAAPVPAASNAAPAPGSSASAAPVATPAGSSGPGSGVVILAIVAVVALLAVAVLVARGRRRATDAAG